MQTVELVAHRGYAGAFPENSLVAVRAALELGVRFVEIDVQLTRDEHVVLFHDRTLDRLCGVDGAIHELPLEEAKKLRLRQAGAANTEFSEEQVVELREIVALFESFPDAKLFVEIKRVSIEQHGAKLALHKILADIAPILERCILISFSQEILELAGEQLPIGLILEDWEQSTSSNVATLAPEYIFCNHTKLPKSGDLELPARLVVYEVTEPELARTLTARGAELVETFQLVDMIEALQ